MSGCGKTVTQPSDRFPQDETWQRNMQDLKCYLFHLLNLHLNQTHPKKTKWCFVRKEKKKKDKNMKVFLKKCTPAVKRTAQLREALPTISRISKYMSSHSSAKQGLCQFNNDTEDFESKDNGSIDGDDESDMEINNDGMIWKLSTTSNCVVCTSVFTAGPTSYYSGYLW